MIPDRHDILVLDSSWAPQGEGGEGRYALRLENRGTAPLHGFRLGFSGPARIGQGARMEGGHIVAQLAGFCLVAPEPGFVLAPGASWMVSFDRLAFAMRHWSDGPGGAFIVRADGTTAAVRVLPTQRPGSDSAPRRGTMRLAAPPPDAPPGVAVLPWPAAVDVNGWREAPPGLALDPADAAGEAAAASFAELAELLFPGEALARTRQQGGLPVRLRPAPGLARAAYALAFTAEDVRIEAATDTGFLYGLVSLGQILRGARRDPRRFAFPAAGRIEDAPGMGWRGCHLDVARRYYAPGELRRFLAILAWNKLNVFHWHLSDDEAWRVEIDALPELAARGGWRGHGLAVPPQLGSGARPEGGVYSKADMRDLVALAARFGIEIVPEIDVPGHSFALLAALPHLRDPGESAGGYASIQGFPDNCLNPAVEAVYAVLDTVIEELAGLFPSPRFHIGADEVPEGAWRNSPLAAALAQELGVGGTVPLQAHFLRRLQAMLAARGKMAGAWEEAAEGGGIGRDGAYLVGWRSAASARRLAGRGYDVVVAPGQAYYLDMANSEEWEEPGGSWAGHSSPEATYRFEPAAGWTAAERERLLGVQACIWSEPMGDGAVFDRLVFPRLSAIAETGWSAPGRRDFARFSAVAGLMPNLYGHFEP